MTRARTPDQPTLFPESDWTAEQTCLAPGWKLYPASVTVPIGQHHGPPDLGHDELAEWLRRLVTTTDRRVAVRRVNLAVSDLTVYVTLRTSVWAPDRRKAYRYWQDTIAAATRRWEATH